MKITGNDYEIARYVNETTAPSQEKEQTEQTSALTPEESREDVIVELSEESKEVQKAKEAIESEPDVRSEEVSAIKKEIEEGNYEIDYDSTAEKMVGQFIDEIVG